MYFSAEISEDFLTEYINEIRSKQLFYEKNIDIVCDEILKIYDKKPIIDDLVSVGIFSKLEYQKLIDNLNLYQYFTPPRGNVYSNFIVSGIVPAFGNYKCESTMLFGKTTTLYVLLACRYINLFPYFTNVFKDAHKYTNNRDISEVKKTIKEILYINKLNNYKKTNIIFLGKSYEEFNIIKRFLLKNYPDKFNVKIIKHPSFYVRKNDYFGFVKEFANAYFELVSY